MSDNGYNYLDENKEFSQYEYDTNANNINESHTFKIPFIIEGVIIYHSNTNKITRNIKNINIINGEGFIDISENDNHHRQLAIAKLVIARRIAEIKANLKNKDSSQNGEKKGGRGYAKNSTEYKKQKEILKTKTLRFKSTSNNKTCKK